MKGGIEVVKSTKKKGDTGGHAVKASIQGYRNPDQSYE